MSKTLADLPTDLHRLILSHDEEKIQIKKDNEKLKTQVKMLQCLLDEARQEDDYDIQPSDEEDELNNLTNRILLSCTVTDLRQELRDNGIKGFSKANKNELAERVALLRY